MQHQFVDKFLKVMQSHSEMTGKTILAGVSGGIDSVVLLHLLHSNGFKAAVAHCNFQLRGSDSDDDENFVKQLAEEYQNQCFVMKFETASFAKKHGISVQMAARQLRLDFMNRLLREHHFSCSCLAHHHDDNIETFFLNLTRGTGIKGIRAMSVLSENIFRPLLFATRSEIAEYAARHNLNHREDVSNSKDDYLRNRIRHHVLPQFVSQFPGFYEVMIDNFRRFSSGLALHEELCKNALKDCVSFQENRMNLDLRKISVYENSAILLGEFLSDYGFTFLQAEQMMQSADKTETSVFQSDEYEAFLKSGFLDISIREQATDQSYVISSPECFSTFALPLQISSELLKNNADLNLKAGPEHAYFDASRVEFPLILRKWKAGDVFFPFGMKGKKRISDYFTDLKMSSLQKRNTWLLCSGEDIVWVVGYRIDQRFAVRFGTENILHLISCSK